MGRKINFSKAEEELGKAMQKMSVDRLLELGQIANLARQKKGVEGTRAALAEEKIKERLLGPLRAELRYIQKKDASFFSQLRLDELEYEKLLSNPERLRAKDWEKIRQVRAQIAHHAKEWRKQLPSEGDDEGIVLSERKKHINKRFNVRDGWLPLK